MAPCFSSKKTISQMKLFMLIVGLEAAPGYGTYNILMAVSDSSDRELYSVKSTLYLGPNFGFMMGSACNI